MTRQDPYDLSEPYRAPASRQPVGKKLTYRTIMGVEEHLIERLRDAVADYKTETYVTGGGTTKKKTRYDKGVEYGTVLGLAEGLAAVQTGSDYFNGDEPKNLIRHYTMEYLKSLPDDQT